MKPPKFPTADWLSMIKPKHICTRLKRYARRFGPRRFHSYCVGAAKTGTTSIASIFSENYRSTHEPETGSTNKLVISYLRGELEKNELQSILVKRDQELKLEMESAHPLGYIAGVLCDVFPNASFVVTIREPMSWLKSRLNFHHKTDHPSWKEYRHYFWTRHHEGFAPEEIALRKFNLCSLDVYLNQYADHYRRVLKEVPEDRRLIVNTSKIDYKVEHICDFVGARYDKVIPSHRKKSDEKISPLDEIDSAFVKARIMHHCGNLVERFFPERLDFYKSIL